VKLTAQNVHEIFMGCLFANGESTNEFIKAEGVQMNIGFHPGRIKENEENIISMLSDLPDQFMKSKGGGWSFLNACQDKNNEQWADMHQSVDELLCLGLAISKIKFLFGREMWRDSPGGVPYFMVID